MIEILLRKEIMSKPLVLRLTPQNDSSEPVAHLVANRRCVNLLYNVFLAYWLEHQDDGSVGNPMPGEGFEIAYMEKVRDNLFIALATCDGASDVAIDLALEMKRKQNASTNRNS